MPPRPVRITWIGHATVLVEAAGYRILTDPALTTRLAFLRRRVPTISIGAVDAILISHVHTDHLHARSLRTVANGVRILVPAGGERLLRGLDAASIQVVRPGNCFRLVSSGDESAALEVSVVHAEHSANRGAHSRVSARPVGYVIEADGYRIYFAGDTDLFDEMHQLGPLDLALLPIWGWGPRLGKGHLDPPRAATATSWIQPRFVVPIHWGTYSPVRMRRGSPAWLNRPMDDFRHALFAHDMGDRLIGMEPGDSILLE